MNNHDLLLNNDITYEKMYTIANNIIKLNELPLTTEQMLLAFENIRKWLYVIDMYDMSVYKKNRIFLLNKVLNINKNMYVGIILALCQNFEPFHLNNFIVFDRINNNKPIDIGLNNDWRDKAIKNYYKLLNYCEFDVSNIKCLSDMDRQIIQTYRAEKYAGKSTKCAKK